VSFDKAAVMARMSLSSYIEPVIVDYSIKNNCELWRMLWEIEISQNEKGPANHR
jgi:hypothetical protein